MTRLRRLPKDAVVLVALARLVALVALIALVALVALVFLRVPAAHALDAPASSTPRNARLSLDGAPAISGQEAALLAAALDESFASSPSVGLSAGVLHDGRTWTAARGLARLEPLIPATPRTTYRLASVTKTFTAIAAMKLVEEGKLHLDDEVQRFLPAFPRKPWPITVRQLLAHTSGIGHYRNHNDATSTTHVRVRDALKIFQERELLAEPGSRFVYTTFGYNLLGAVVEKAGGVSYEEAVRRLWEPLGMTRTSLERGVDERANDDALGYRLVGGAIAPSERIDISSRFAGGGMRSTVEDMLRWAHALLETAAGRPGALVSPAAWRAMTTPTVTADGRQADYGLGFAVYPQRGLHVVAHAGGQAETSTLLLLVPERSLAIALATNLEGDAKRLSALAERFTEILLEGGRRRPDLVAVDPVDDVIYDGLTRTFSWGITTRALPRASAQVDEAFTRLAALLSHESISPDPEAARARVRDAYHPAFGRVTPLVGGEIAGRLERALGARALERLRIEGPLAFFQAYADLCRKTPCPPKRQLPATLLDDIRRLQAQGALVPALVPQPPPASAPRAVPRMERGDR